MPTPLKPNRRVVRATDYYARDRGKLKRVIAELSPEGVYLRFERGRSKGALLCTWAAALDAGVRRRLREVQEARKAKRQARRLGL